jgi:ribosome-associated toxin RatA of RatAB toxin-antitoxin module
MNVSDTIWIKASPRAVFRLAEDVERWPELLPHYRYVKLLGRERNKRTVKMAASRTGIPVSWTSLLTPLPRQNKIRFRHIGGVTKGMDVEWRLRKADGGTHVEIYHELSLGWPPLARNLGEYVIARFFIHNIAGKTLRRIKQLAEGS